MSGAEVLRRAASLMRERAERSKTAFGYGPWKVDGLDEYGHYVSVPTEQIGLGSRVAADLIASWHPAVALAVADLLDRLADDREADPYLPKSFDEAALAVARTFLGESS